MILLASVLALTAAAPPGCTDVRQECRACTTRDGKRVCSNIGIAKLSYGVENQVIAAVP